ncbi:MAG: hypothetical protein ACI9P8_002171 [Bacteroidia bacterium]
MHPYFNYFLRDSCDAWTGFQTELNSHPNIESLTNDCPNDSPVIIDNSGTLESTSAGNYQWYLNGVAISGSDLQNHIVSASGTYQVGTINIGNCMVFSNEITVQVTGISNQSSEFTIQRTQSGISITSKIQMLSSVSISDLLGRTVYYRSIEGQKQATITLDNKISPYVIQLRFADGSRKTFNFL